MYGSCGVWGVGRGEPEGGGARGKGAYTIVGEEHALKLCAFGQSHYVLALAYLVSLDVLDRVKDAAGAVSAYRSLADSEDVVTPCCTGYCWRALLAVDTEGHAEEGENADVVC